MLACCLVSLCSFYVVVVFFFWLLAYLFKIKGKIKVERIVIKQIIEIKKTIRKEGSKKVELEKEEWRKEREVAFIVSNKKLSEEISMASLSRALRILLGTGVWCELFILLLLCHHSVNRKSKHSFWLFFIF